MDYGIANKKGKPELSQAIEIVRTAWKNGIRFFDTAQAYGNSEEVLGECFKELKRDMDDNQLSVISKIDPNIKPADEDKILERIEETSEKLGQDNIYGLMLHRESWLEEGLKFIKRVIPKLKAEKKIINFGASVYSIKKAFEALNMDEIDMIQLPFNIFDQRALEHGVFQLADEKNKKIFVRSVYLQGLLLLNPNQVPDTLAFSRDALNKYHNFSRDCDIPPKLLAVAFVLKKAPNAMIVIGSETPGQVKENISLYKKSKDINLPDLSVLSTYDPQLINPSLWQNN